MRTALASLLLAASFATHAQDLNTKITFQAPAARAKPLLEELSKKAGIRLMVAQLLEDEVLLIGVKDKPLNEVMKRVAQAIDGEWASEQDGYRLIRPAALQQKLDRELYERDLGHVTKALKEARERPTERFDAERTLEKLRARTQTEPGSYEDWRQVMDIERQAPAGRLYHALLFALEPADLAGIPSGERRVFSSQPNRMQRALRNDVSETLARFAEEQNLWADAAKKQVDDELHRMRFSSLQFIQPVLSERLKATLSVENGRGDRGLICRLTVLDAGNTTVVERQEEIVWRVDPDLRTLLRPKSGESEIVFSPLSKELLSFLLPAPEKDPPPPSPALVIALANPEKTDPLSLVSSEALQAIADASDLDIVANLHDVLIYALVSPARLSKLTPTTVRAHLEFLSANKIVEEEGWLIFKPLDRSETARYQTDRHALGRLTRIAAKRNPTLDEVAHFAVNCRATEYSPAGQAYMRVLAKEAVPLLGMFRMSGIAFYGSLTIQQRRTLATGEPLAIENLTASQRVEVDRMAMDPMGYLAPKQPVAPPYKPLPREPTEALPDGPSRGTVSVTVTEGDAAFVTIGPYRGDGMFPRDLAWRLMGRERPDVLGQDGEISLDKLKTGKKASVSMTFELADRAVMLKAIHHTTINKDSQPIPLDKFPAPFREETFKVLEELRKMYKNVPVMPTGTQKPPPPQAPSKLN